jgi:hypothetical protein
MLDVMSNREQYFANFHWNLALLLPSRFAEQVHSGCALASTCRRRTVCYWKRTIHSRNSTVALFYFVFRITMMHPVPASHVKPQAVLRR